MKKLQGTDAVEAAIALIEEQLQVIPVSVASILNSSGWNQKSIDATNAGMQLRRRRSPAKTGSVGNIITAETRSDLTLDFQAAYQPMQADPAQRARYLRTVIGNALLAASAFLKAHDMGEIRTPEVRFLLHLHDALLNGYRFTVQPGYQPIATFDGLVIDASLDGTPLFDDDGSPGFMELGDAVALLQWLARYLRGGEHFVTNGDAG